MDCIYCGKETTYSTTLEEPICSHCAEKYGFLLCTELGKYVADDSFMCDFICNNCIYFEK